MTVRARWLALLLVLFLLAGAGVVLARPSGPYAGHVLYLRLRLAPYVGSHKEIQYWIDPAGGRVRYAEWMPQSTTVRASINGVPVTPQPEPWAVVSLKLQPDGTCGVTYTTLLSNEERGEPIACRGVLALGDVRGLQLHALALRRRYGTLAQMTASAIRVPLPAGADLIPLVIECSNMRYGYEMLVPGVLTLDRRTGRPLTFSGYRRGGATMTTTILQARDVPPNTLPGDFFDPPGFSLADRAPALYQWLHRVLPWHP